MKHELKIVAGDMPPQDIYQLSPSDIKQLLLDVLQPQHTGRYSLSFTHTRTRIAQTHIIALYQERYPCFLHTLTHRSAFEDAVSLSQCLYFLYNLFDFNYFIFFLVYIHILLSAAATTQFPLGNYENLILSHLI